MSLGDFPNGRSQPIKAVSLNSTGLEGFHHRIEAWCAKADMAPDLAQDIGSKRWMRGLATLLGLGFLAISFWPDFSSVEAAAFSPTESNVHREYRNQRISPFIASGNEGQAAIPTSHLRQLTGVPERPVLKLSATMGQGDTLSGMLGRAGVSPADIADVSQLVRSAVSTDQIAPGTRFAITLGQRPSPEAARALQEVNFRARFDLGLSVVRRGADLALVRHPVAVDSTPLRIRGQVGSSLYRSARNAGAPIAAIQSYLKAIDSHVSLESDLAESDAFDIVIAYKRSTTGERQLGELLYAGLERDGKPHLQLLRWGKDGEMVAAGSFTSAVTTAPRTMGAPVAGPVTSQFGMRRHPILGFVRMHGGVDFGARYGTPIFAVADGRVSQAGWHGGHGNYVRLEHGGGQGTGYSHMSRVAVAAGSMVRAGQVLGYVGSSGLSTGPHLHFEAYYDGRKVNPMGLRLAAARPQVDQRELGAYRQRLNALLAIRPGEALSPVAAAPSPSDGGREINRVAQAGSGMPSHRESQHQALASAADLPRPEWRNHNY